MARSAYSGLLFCHSSSLPIIVSSLLISDFFIFAVILGFSPMFVFERATEAARLFLLAFDFLAKLCNDWIVMRISVYFVIGDFVRRFRDKP